MQNIQTIEDLNNTKIFDIKYNGYVRDGEWNHDSYTVKCKTFNNEFKQGTGIKEPPKNADILYCLLSDLELSQYDSFNDFCELFAYDNDSIKALKIYKQVLKQNKAFLKVFSEEEIENFRKLLEDF